MMEFAPVTDMPYRRLPPLQMIHGQPVLDLDTPPPSSCSSPVTTPLEAKEFKKSALPHFTSEEINHSLTILQSCFEELEPDHLPTLKSHGRVSSSFGHNKYSISLACLYGRLANLRVEQAKLLFVRDCASRLSQLMEFIHTLQSLVQDEEKTLTDFLSGRDSEPNTKLELLPVICEELRLHLNHIPSIQHRLHTDHWLKREVPHLLTSVHKFDHYLRHLQQNAVAWVHTFIVTGFKVYSYFHVSMLSPELLKNIVSSVEDFNRLLKQFRMQLSAHPCGSVCVCNISGARSGFRARKGTIFRKLKPFRCRNLLERIASCRAKVSAFRTFYFIMANSKLLTSMVDRQSEFDWKLVCPANHSSSDNGQEGLWFGGPRGRAISRSLEIDFAASESPLCGLHSAEEEFVVKLLTSAATSSGLLQKLRLKRASQSKDEKDPVEFVESISVKLVPSETTMPADHKENNKKTTTRFKRGSLARKSVRWGDSLNAQVKKMMLDCYFEEFWRTFGTHLKEFFTDPCVGAKGDVDIELLGSSLVWNDENTQLLLGAIQKYSASKDTPRISSMFSSFSLDLYTSAAISAWDEEYCRALGSSTKDKCLLPYQGNHDDQESTTTCHLFVSSLTPLLSVLSLSLGERINKPEDAALSQQLWDGTQNNSQMVLLDAALTTINAMHAWCKNQSSKFLASWKVQQFLLVTQGDLKIVTDHTLSVFKICTSMAAEIGGVTRSADPLRALRVDKQKARVEDVASHLHNLSSWSSSQFARDCQRICDEFWPQAMPLGKEWRKKTTSVLPSEHNHYAEVAIETILKPVTEGVTHLKSTTQITVVSIATTKMLDTWMSFILKEKPKFSLHGACQLEQDLNFVHSWLASDACGLKPDSKQSILSLDAVRNFHAAVHLLKFQPPGKLGIGLSSSKDEISSEYSISTAPSDSQKEADGVATSTPPVQRSRQTGMAATNSDPGQLSHQGENEEELVQVPRKKEWLSLRVHQGNRWKLSFSCLNNNNQEEL